MSPRCCYPDAVLTAPQVQRAMESTWEASAACSSAVESAQCAVGELDQHPVARSSALLGALSAAGEAAKRFYGVAAKTNRLADAVLHTLSHVNRGVCVYMLC